MFPKPKVKVTLRDYVQMVLIAIGAGFAVYLAIVIWL